MAKCGNCSWLREQYEEECRSESDIAKECDVNPRTVRYHVNEHGFVHKYKKDGWLDKKFNDEGLSVDEICELCNKSRGTIENWLGRKGIDWKSSN